MWKTIVIALLGWCDFGHPFVTVHHRTHRFPSSSPSHKSSHRWLLSVHTEAAHELTPSSLSIINNNLNINDEEVSWIQAAVEAEALNPSSSLLNVPSSSTMDALVAAATTTTTVTTTTTTTKPTTSLSLWQGRWIVILAAAIFGTNFALIKLVDHRMPLEESAVIRFTLAALVTTILAFSSSSSSSSTAASHTHNIMERVDRWKATLCGLEVGVWYWVGYTCQAIGLETAHASKSAFFNSLAVLVVPLLDVLLRQKRLGQYGYVSIALALLGVGILELGPSSSSSLPSLQDGFCLAQAIMFGIGYWRLERISTQYPQQAGPITAGQLLGVAGGSWIYWLLLSLQNNDHHANVAVSLSRMATDWLSDPVLVSALLWTGLISTALALFLETVALQVVSASELTILMTSVSLWGSAFAFLTLGEIVSPVGMLGGLLILAGCIVSTKQGEKKTTET